MAICSVWSYAAWSYACSAYSTAAGISRGCLTHCTETVITSGPCPTWSPIYPPNWSLNWSLSTYLITYTLTYMLTYIPTYILTYLVTIHLPDHLPIHTHPTRNTYILTPHVIEHLHNPTHNIYILAHRQYLHTHLDGDLVHDPAATNRHIIPTSTALDADGGLVHRPAAIRGALVGMHHRAAGASTCMGACISYLHWRWACVIAVRASCLTSRSRCVGGHV